MKVHSTIKVATKEHCFYCFDIVLATLLGKKCEVPAEFPSSDKSALCLWWFSLESEMKPVCIGSMSVVEGMTLRSHEFHKLIAKSIKTTTPPITLDSLPTLFLQLDFIQEDTMKPIEYDDTPSLKEEEGLLVTSNVDLSLKIAVFPTYMQHQGWSGEEAVDKVRDKYNREEYTDERGCDIGVMLQRFDVSTCRYSYEDYKNEHETRYMDKHLHTYRTHHNIIPSSTFHPKPTQMRIFAEEGKGTKKGKDEEEKINKKMDRILRRRQRLIQAAKGGEQKNHRKGERRRGDDGGWGKIATVCIVVLLAVGVIVLRSFEETYNTDYEDFTLNYHTLGLPTHAPLKQVKKAFRELSKKWHPDKNPGCDHCASKYIEIAEAHKQIVDYERGILVLDNRPQQGQGHGHGGVPKRSRSRGPSPPR